MTDWAEKTPPAPPAPSFNELFTPKGLILDFSSVPFLDSSGANVIASVMRKASRHGVKVYVTGSSYDVRKELANHGVASPAVTILTRIEDAVWRGPAAQMKAGLAREARPCIVRRYSTMRELLHDGLFA